MMSRAFLKMMILLLQPSPFRNYTRCQVWLTTGMLSATRCTHFLDPHQNPTASGSSDHPCFLAWSCGLAWILWLMLSLRVVTTTWWIGGICLNSCLEGGSSTEA